MTAFDLSQLNTRVACEEGADLEVLHPVTKEKLGCVIRLIGADADSYRDAMNRRVDARVAALQRGKTATAEDNEREQIALLVAATRNWTGIVENGEALKFSEAEAKRIYTQYPWLAEQVNAFITDRANFLRA